MRKVFFFVAILGSYAVANETAGHGVDQGVPIKLIFVQALNLSVLVGILVYLFRAKVAAHFQKRSNDYHELVSRAERTRAEVEEKKREIENRLTQLEMGAAEQRRKLEAETAQLKNQIVGEARKIASGLVEEGKRLVALEVEKAKNHMRSEMIDLAFENATVTLSTKVGETERKRLQDEFVERIQVVR